MGVPVIVRNVIVCEDVIQGPGGRCTLVTPLTDLGMARGVRERWVMPRCAVYVQLTDGLGDYRIDVEIRAFDSNFRINPRAPQTVSFGAHGTPSRDTVIECVFRYRNLHIVRPEKYVFQVMSNYVELPNGAAEVSILPGVDS